MGVALERYNVLTKKEPIGEKRADFGRLGLAGEKEYEFRFGDVDEKREAQAELLKITEGLRDGGALEVLDRRVMSFMQAVDVKKFQPNDVLDNFIGEAESIAREMVTQLKNNGVKDVDTLEASPWAVLRAGERLTAKFMQIKEDPRANEILSASTPLGGDIEFRREYDVPDWTVVLGGALGGEVIDFVQSKIAGEGKSKAEVAVSAEVITDKTFSQVQQELQELVDNPDPNRERVLVNERAKILAKVKKAGVLDSIAKDVVVAQNSANMDFKQAYQAVRDMEAVQYEVQLRGQGILRPEWEGVVDHYRLGVVRNMEIAMLEETASRRQPVDRERLENLKRERSLLGWGNPPPDVRAMAKRFLDDVDTKRRAIDEARQKVDAEKQATDQARQLLEATREQTQKLKTLEEKLGELKRGGADDAATNAVERQIAGLRQDMAAGRQTESGNPTTAILDALRKTMSGEVSEESFPTGEREWGDWLRHRLDIIERSTAMATELANQGAFSQAGKAMAELLKALNEKPIPAETTKEVKARLRLYASWAAINKVGWNVDPSKGLTIEMAAQEISMTTNYWAEWGGIKGEDIQTLLSDNSIAICWDLLQRDVSRTETELAQLIGDGQESVAKARIAKRLFRATFEESMAKGRQLVDKVPPWKDDGGDKGARCYYLDDWLLFKNQGPEATRKSKLIKGFGTSYLRHLGGIDETNRDSMNGNTVSLMNLEEGDMGYTKFLEDRVSQYMVALSILMRKDFSVAEAADDKLDPWWTAFGKSINAADPEKRLRLGFYWLLGSRVGMTRDIGSEARDRTWQLRWEPFVNMAIQKGFVAKKEKGLFKPGIGIFQAALHLRREEGL